MSKKYTEGIYLTGIQKSGDTTADKQVESYYIKGVYHRAGEKMLVRDRLFGYTNKVRSVYVGFAHLSIVFEDGSRFTLWYR